MAKESEREREREEGACTVANIVAARFTLSELLCVVHMRLHRRRHLALIHSCNEAECNHRNTKTTSIMQFENVKKMYL